MWILSFPNLWNKAGTRNLEAERQFIVDDEIREIIDRYCADVSYITQAQVQKWNIPCFLEQDWVRKILGKELASQLKILLKQGCKLNLRIRNAQIRSQNHSVFTIKITPKKWGENISNKSIIHTLQTSKRVERILDAWKIRGEYDIPLSFRDAMLGINDILRMNEDVTEIEKTRYTLHEWNHEVWYVDVYTGINEGIIQAEQEIFLQEKGKHIILPPRVADIWTPSRWIPMHDITDDGTHPWLWLSGKELQKYPYEQWREEEKKMYEILVMNWCIK